MNRNRLHPLDSRRSPQPRRRRSLLPQSPELARSLPAITLLSPEAYHLQGIMSPRPLSPAGSYRMIPPRSAKSKMMSFVILNENLTSPVTSRSPSPTGRVSPFRGHGFKSPTTSKPTSRSTSPVPAKSRRYSVVAPTEGPRVTYADIGLPPKSPKRALKNVQIKPYKPVIKPKPILPNNVGNSRMATKKAVVANRGAIMFTVDAKNDKKFVPKKPVGKKPGSKAKEDNKSNVSEIQQASSDGTTTTKEVPSESPIKEDNDKVTPQITENPPPPKTSDPATEPEKEKLIPCYQPDKCCIVPPTMASPSQTATSTITTPATVPPKNVNSSSMSAITSAMSMTDTLSKKSASLRPKPEDRLKSPLLTEPKQGEKPPSPAVRQEKPEGAVLATATMTTVDEVIKSRVASAVSHRSVSRLSIDSPTLSDRTRSSMVTVRAASNGSLKNARHTKLDVETIETGDVISTTSIIHAEPDLEVLSANNLLGSPMREPILNGARLPNGRASPSTEPKSRCRRFLAALNRLLTYIFCCWKRCAWPNCCSRAKCKNCCKKTETSNQKTQRCQCNPCSPFLTCFKRLNCCKNIKCSSCCKGGCCSGCKKCSPCCGKLKCCEGKQCCNKKRTGGASKMCCCAKSCCNCKECCGSVKDCCLNCGDRINNCCRSLFCLNLACCQRCLKKCSCCHKLKCCKKGGCCSCCNPYVKREQRIRLDKKTSRASNQSKQERPKLDAALVEHTSIMKAAIPVLPACLAWFCAFFNLFIPGSGTLLSGVLCLCFGKPRFSVNDSPQNRVSSFLVNVIIAVSQAFTIIFCLVGWGWSIWWGVIMVKLARKQKRLKLAEKNQEGAPSNVNQNHVDPERSQ